MGSQDYPRAIESTGALVPRLDIWDQYHEGDVGKWKEEGRGERVCRQARWDSLLRMRWEFPAGQCGTSRNQVRSCGGG